MGVKQVGVVSARAAPCKQSSQHREEEKMPPEESISCQVAIPSGLPPDGVIGVCLTTQKAAVSPVWIHQKPGQMGDGREAREARPFVLRTELV